MYIRASIGTLAKLGLLKIKLLSSPTTAYLLQYSERGCLGKCLYCSQSIFSKASKENLSRVEWPKIKIDELISKIQEKEKCFKRICLQTIIKPFFIQEVREIIKLIKENNIQLPISITITPLPKPILIEFKKLGVDRIGVGLDAATEDIFIQMKKPYTWNTYLKYIKNALKIFGKNKVSVHLIYGLGETDIQFLKTAEKIIKLGAFISLFPFTPIKNTSLEKRPKPEIQRYRTIQIAVKLLLEGYRLDEILSYVSESGKVSIKPEYIDKVFPKAFLTLGCPGCNRPFYTETPLKIYNYPDIKLLERDLDLIRKQLTMVRT